MNPKHRAFINRFFTCNIGPLNRLLRGSSGVIVNFLALIFIDKLPAIAFWSMIIVSYLMLLEAFVGCCVVHAVLNTKDFR